MSRGEHHQHQQNFLTNSVFDFPASEATAGAAIRPPDSARPQGEHHQHQQYFLSFFLFDFLASESTASVAVRPND